MSVSKSLWVALKPAVAAIAALTMFAAAPASAAVITIGTTGATITCSVGCEGFSGAGGLDIDPGAPDIVDPTGLGTLGSLAQLYNGEPADEADEGARLSTLVGAPVGAGTKFDPPTNPFDSVALYIVLKLGRNDVFIQNTAGVLQTYTLDLNGATGLGLSHYTEFGEVPLPAAGWLMLAGLAGLGFARRRVKSA